MIDKLTLLKEISDVVRDRTITLYTPRPHLETLFHIMASILEDQKYHSSEYDIGVLKGFYPENHPIWDHIQAHKPNTLYFSGKEL